MLHVIFSLVFGSCDIRLQVVEARLECSEEDRDERLYYMLTQHPGRTLVFANAISMVRRLASILRLLQLPVTPLHASMQQRQRLKALDRFRKSSNAILVATDVAARGLDIQARPVVLSKHHSPSYGTPSTASSVLGLHFASSSLEPASNRSLPCSENFCGRWEQHEKRLAMRLRHIRLLRAVRASEGSQRPPQGILKASQSEPRG